MKTDSGENISEQDIFHRMENWGYYLLPKSHPNSPGYTGLLVAIREIPTEQHFDPELIYLRLRNEDDLASWQTLRLQSPFSGPKRVCPGRVVLYDRIDKRAHFFTFGGSLEVISDPNETVYWLHSPGPILEITSALNVPNQLAFEVQALLGECQAKWGSNDNGFAFRLTQIDPLQFYLASLQVILIRFQQHQPLRESAPEFYAMLQKEKEWLEQAGQWPATLPSLENLFAPNY